MRISLASLWPVLFGVLIGLLAAGVLLLVVSPRRGQAVQLLPPPTPAPLQVYVSGAVAQPGLVALARGSRAADAIQAAGGMLPEADSEAINLAALLEDGQQLRVPSRQEIPLPAAAERGGAEIPLGVPGVSGGPVNINTAGQDELESLPGIGPVMAQAIIDHRTANGPFASIEAIQDVVGIGPGIFAKIKELITVGF
jgi:competence protein ComEA